MIRLLSSVAASLFAFAALAHDDDAIREIEAGASGALVALRDEEDNQ